MHTIAYMDEMVAADDLKGTINPSDYSIYTLNFQLILCTQKSTL